MRQLLAWSGIAVLIVVILLVAAPPRVDGVVDLTGVWQGRVVEDGEIGPARPLWMPGLFARRGLDSDARVQLSRTVVIPDDGVHRSVWIENPQYAIRVLWDGEEIDAAGDPSSERRQDRTDIAVLAPLPRDPGPHELVLDVRGDYAEGGLTGRILLGPRDTLRALQHQGDADKLGLALMLALVGIVQLGVARGKKQRDAYLLFGLFACLLAVWSFVQSDTSQVILGDLVARLRIRRVTLGLIPPVGVAFVAAFVRGRVRREEWAFVVWGALYAALAVVAPAHTLYPLEAVGDAAVLVGLGWYVVICVRGVATGAGGAPLLLVTTLPPVLVAAIGDMFVSHGFAAGGWYLVPAFILFVVGVTVTLAIWHADDADRHARLLAGSADAMISVDPDGGVLEANPAAQALLGRTSGARNLMQWVDPDDHPLVRAHVSRALEGNDRAEFRLSQGGRVVESMATRVDSRTTLLVLRDVTRRRELDRGMLQAARIETVGVLVGGIAHDFNNLLGTLLAHVGFLQATSEDAAANERLGRMESAIERASLLTRRLLTVSGGTSTDLHAIRIESVCRGAAELVEPMLPSGVSLELDVPDEVAPVLGAPSDLEQVLVNLLVNARDAVGQQGRIVLRVRPFVRKDGAKGAVVIVEDDGPGVPAALEREIFAPFVTTKPPNKGTGLGLAVSAQIVRDHHGRIWVEPRPGGGARFLVALRHADAVEEAPAPLPEDRRVLIAEDEAALLEDYARALRGAGYEVAACASGAAAAAQLQGGAPGILVTDVVMPGMSGIELAELCERMYPEVPILLVSGFVPEGAVRPGWSRLDKPVRAARLVAMVGRIRRRAERARRGDVDITEVSWLFPPLDTLTSAELGLDDPAPTR